VEGNSPGTARESVARRGGGAEEPPRRARHRQQEGMERRELREAQCATANHVYHRVTSASSMPMGVSRG